MRLSMRCAGKDTSVSKLLFHNVCRVSPFDFRSFDKKETASKAMEILMGLVSADGCQTIMSPIRADPVVGYFHIWL